MKAIINRIDIVFAVAVLAVLLAMAVMLAVDTQLRDSLTAWQLGNLQALAADAQILFAHISL